VSFYELFEPSAISINDPLPNIICFGPFYFALVKTYWEFFDSTGSPVA